MSLGRSRYGKHLSSRESNKCKGPVVGTGETELGQTLLLPLAGKPRHKEKKGQTQSRTAGRGGARNLWGRHTGTGTSVDTPWAESSRLLEGQPPLPEPSQLLRGLMMSWIPCLMTNVFHPHLIMQQTPMNLSPSGPTSWAG